MTSKLTRDIIQSEIADFFAGVVEIHTELGGPNTVEEAQNQLTDRVLACVPGVDSEPVAWRWRSGPNAWWQLASRGDIDGEVEPLYRHAQPAPDQILCDFYEVNSWPDLVRELVKHVEQLQDSAKRNVKPWEDTFPETLLPAYIERVKQADEACRAAMLQAGSDEIGSWSNRKNTPIGTAAPDKKLTDDVLDEIIAGAKTSMEQYLALSLKAEREVWRKEGPTDDERIMAIEGMRSCEWCSDEGWVVGEMGITRCSCSQAGNSPVIPDRWIPVSERMPEDRISVILWDAEIGEVTSGHYSHKTQTFYHCGDAIENEITHWMPPPCAPQEVK